MLSLCFSHHSSVGFGWDFSFMPYGRRWRELRKAFVRKFHPPALSHYHPTILQGTRELLLDFLNTPNDFIKHLRKYVAVPHK